MNKYYLLKTKAINSGQSSGWLGYRIIDPVPMIGFSGYGNAGFVNLQTHEGYLTGVAMKRVTELEAAAISKTFDYGGEKDG